MKIANTSTAGKADANPPSTNGHPKHSTPFTAASSSSEQATPSGDDSNIAHLIEKKHGYVEEGNSHNSSFNPDAQEPAPKHKESPSSSDDDVFGAVPLPDKDIASDDIFLDNVAVDTHSKEDKMAMSHPMMKAKDNMIDNTTPDNRKNQPSSVIYDLGATPPTTSKLPTKKISTAAQKLLARIPSVSHKKKRSQGNEKSITNGEMYKNTGSGEDEKNDASNSVHVSVEEFHAQKMRIQELEENYERRIRDMEENHDRRIRDLEENRDSRIRDMEENHDRRIRDLEENRDSRIQELVQQEMQSLLSEAREVPQGAADSEATNTASNGQQQNNTPNMRRSVATYAIFRNYAMMFGQDKETNKANLENDTFSLMMISKVRSRSWALGLVAFIFQIVLGNMIAIDQATLSYGSSIFSVPFKVDLVVRVGQFFAIILCLATQSDILTSVQSVLLLSKGSDWDEVIGERGDKSTRVWLIRIFLPNLLKFAQGILVTYVSFVIIVQSDDIIDLLKDFTALMVLAETDNILYLLASYGYLGQTLMDQTTKVLVTTVPTAPTHATDTSTVPSIAPARPSVERRQRTSFCIRFVVLLCLFALMLGGWVSIVMNQINGEFFRAKYPKCNFTGAFEEAKKHFGDGICYGGRLNTLGCAFEGDDCVNFNLAFPLCKGDDLANVEEKVGNGKCDPELNIANCNFDGNDCPFESRYPNCPHIDLANKHFGDGVCYGGPLNTLECEFEGGDCANFNSAYPLCKGDDLVDVQNELGNGECNQTFNTPECNFDGEDCAFETRYPRCPHVTLAKEHFGDGVCYGGPLNSVECDFENGDCVNFNLAYPLCKGDDKTDVQNHVGNGICEEIFSGADCLYDGGDCCPTEVFNDLSFGDGICNGGMALTEGCHYDNRDCDDFHSSYPNCALDELSQVEGAGDTVIGDGVCNSGIYSSTECGYESGDCNYGQMGQTISITPDEIGGVSQGTFFMSKALSLDGMTMALGMPFNAGVNGYYPPPGLVKILRYDNIRKMWLQIGNSIVSSEEEGYVGYVTGLSSNGNRVMALGSMSDETSFTRVYDFNVTKDDWVQEGQTIYSELAPISTMSTDGSKVAMLHSDIEIRVYDIISSNYTVIELGAPIVFGEWLYYEDYGVINFAELRFNSLDGSRLVVSGAGGVTRIFRFNPAANSTSWTQIGQDFFTFSPPVISADGNRIAVASRPDSDDTAGQIDVLDYNDEKNEWISVGNPIKSISSSDGDEFSFNIEMSSDGNVLIIVSNSPGCHSWFIEGLLECTTESVELYTYYQSSGFQPVIPNLFSPYKANENVLNLADLSKSGEIFGVDYSMNGDGSVLLISGFMLLGDNDDPILDSSYIKVYDLKELFYTKCTASDPGLLGDGTCYDRPPYNSEECGFDGGDCNDPKPVTDYPNCTVIDPSKIDNNNCDDYAPYNTKECGYDGGDCPSPVDGYPDCLIRNDLHGMIGNGRCNDEYNTTECGYDDGDCIEVPVEGYPECMILPQYHSKIGDGTCDDSPMYNVEECGFDGGDCTEEPVEGYPGCLILPQYHDKIGNRLCDSQYNTTECGFDGGDCTKQPVEGYPDCFLFPQYQKYIGNGLCNDSNGDGQCTIPRSGGVVEIAVDDVMKASFSSSCNTEECGFDGGDCIKTPVEGYPDCVILPQYHDEIGNGRCDEKLPHYTELCGFDGGDCERNPVVGYPCCFAHEPSKIGDGCCNLAYNKEECGFDGGDCRGENPKEANDQCWPFSPPRPRPSPTLSPSYQC